jgi:hypothetical protein
MPTYLKVLFTFAHLSKGTPLSVSTTGPSATPVMSGAMASCCGRCLGETKDKLSKVSQNVMLYVYNVKSYIVMIYLFLINLSLLLSLMVA